MAKQEIEKRQRRALRSAAAWLKRRGAARQNPEVKRVYNSAASLIMRKQFAR